MIFDKEEVEWIEYGKLVHYGVPPSEIMGLSDDEKIYIIEFGAVERQLELEAMAELTGYYVAKAMRKMMGRRR